MRISSTVLLAGLGALQNALTVAAWGAAGHQIVATIAQIHLMPSVRNRLCDILPYNARCHLAPYSTWADQIKGKPEYRYTAQLHYVNPLGDWPAEKCLYGEKGWTSEKNILAAIVNVTAGVLDTTGDRQDVALRFLTHYIGDLHQPMHLSGRDRGGNEDRVRFEGRMSNLHSVWDTQLITKSIRELSNYTSPVPSKRIESALRGSIFDPYVRWIVWEGIRGWWADEWLHWAECPEDGDVDPSVLIPRSLDEDAPDFPQQTVQRSQIALSSSYPAKRDLPVCPMYWSTPIHEYNCKYVWPPHYDTHDKKIVELDTPQYLGKVHGDKVVEKLLAMAGVRLAAVLNTLLADPEEMKGNFTWD